MNFSKNLIKNIFFNTKQIFNYRKLTLLKCSSKILVSSSFFNLDEKLLMELKEVLDKINYCIAYCDEYLEKINNETDFASDFEDSLSSLFDSISFIDKFINNLIVNTNVIFENDSYIPPDNINKLETDNKKLNLNKLEDNNPNTESNNTTNEENIETVLDNNILLISEKSRKVFLPYKVSDLEKQLKNNKIYKNIQSLIDEKYVLPLEQFSNAILARFRQTYTLCRDKSKKSISSSIELAFELAFNYSLNPAIIAACKNIDELDIYLDCLEENELDKFDLFEIKYEFSPR